ANGVEVVASLPCWGAANVEKQRGRGVFEKSIAALRDLNALGYAQPGSGLVLDLVYNPVGAFLPPPQATLEARYREELRARFGIEFRRLLTITNMPIRRFADALRRAGELGAYLGLLVNHFNPATVPGLMCRSLVSIGWDGHLYDCDFKQMLDLRRAGGRGLELRRRARLTGPAGHRPPARRAPQRTHPAQGRLLGIPGMEAGGRRAIVRLGAGARGESRWASKDAAQRVKRAAERGPDTRGPNHGVADARAPPPQKKGSSHEERRMERSDGPPRRRAAAARRLRGVGVAPLPRLLGCGGPSRAPASEEPPGPRDHDRESRLLHGRYADPAGGGDDGHERLRRDPDLRPVAEGGRRRDRPGRRVPARGDGAQPPRSDRSGLHVAARRHVHAGHERRGLRAAHGTAPDPADPGHRRDGRPVRDGVAGGRRAA